MKKSSVLGIGIVVLFLSGCSMFWNIGFDTEIEEYNGGPISFRWDPLTCESQYYTNIYTTKRWTNGTDKNRIVVRDGSEIFEYSWKKEKNIDPFWLDEQGKGTIAFAWNIFNVFSETSNQLIGVRNYEPSWMLETIHLDRDTGIMINTKTFTKGMGDSPSSSTYLFYCK